MRKEILRMGRDASLALLERAEVVHIASTTAEGVPLFRTLNGVVVRDAIAFHGAPAGEKIAAIGREVVVAAEEIVANIPSYFLDPERACPATVLYRSVQVHGTLQQIDDPERKAEVLRALMRKYQPEGGYAPIDHEDPRYKKSIEGLLIVAVSLERLDGKAKLAQNRTPAERCRLMEKLWQRGASGDCEAIELIRAAAEDTPLPAFLRGPAGLSLAVALGPDDAAAAAALLDGAYWNDGLDRDVLARLQAASSAWVGARDAEGALVATARAISDVHKRAWIYDVMVAPAYRGRGIGEALVRLLLDHPALRGVHSVLLGTRDAQPFYARLGFRERAALPRSYPSTEMVLSRDDRPR